MLEDDDLLQTFLEEASENFQVIEESLLELEKNPGDFDLINSVFRAMHTIKGSAGLMGLNDLGEMAHHLENILEKIRKKNGEVTEQVCTLLLTGCDLLKQMIDTGDYCGEGFQKPIAGLLELIKEYEQSNENKSVTDHVEEKTSLSGKKYFKIVIKLNDRILDTGTDPLMLLMDLDDNEKILKNHLNISDLPDLREIDPNLLYIYWTMFLETEKSHDQVKKIFMFIAEDNDENVIIVDDITEETASLIQSGKNIEEIVAERGWIITNEGNSEVTENDDLSENIPDEKELACDAEENAFHKPLKFREKEETTSTIRVDTNKLSNLLNGMAELLIAQSCVKEMVSTTFLDNDLVNEEVFNSFDEVDKIIRSLQEEVMNASMIPIGSTFIRFQRIARDLAKDMGKELEMLISGKETELDKKVIEQIADPLKHIIRNTLDHGLEKPEERIKNGKPPAGTLSLNAFHQEGNIVIEISDDGRGIDKDMVLAKAREKGLINTDYTPNESEIYNLLFMPGFSTAKEISDISGRGVGLDVVRSNIHSLRGSVDIYSEKGQGTTFTIKLPLTLAIIEGMIVRVGIERLVIPLNAIAEFIKAAPNDVRQLEGKGSILQLRDKSIPYFRLFELLGLSAHYKSHLEGIIIVLNDGSKKIGMLIDEIIGQEQIVIKSIKDNMEQIDGIAGATIMGDGKVAIILDIPSLFRLVRQKDRLTQLSY